MQTQAIISVQLPAEEPGWREVAERALQVLEEEVSAFAGALAEVELENEQLRVEIERYLAAAERADSDRRRHEAFAGQLANLVDAVQALGRGELPAGPKSSVAPSDLDRTQREAVA